MAGGDLYSLRLTSVTGDFFIHISGTWVGMTQSLGMARIHEQSAFMGLTHVSWAFLHLMAGF